MLDMAVYKNSAILLVRERIVERFQGATREPDGCLSAATMKYPTCGLKDNDCFSQKESAPFALHSPRQNHLVAVV